MLGHFIECAMTGKQLTSIDNDALYLWCKRLQTNVLVVHRVMHKEESSQWNEEAVRTWRD